MAHVWYSCRGLSKGSRLNEIVTKLNELMAEVNELIEEAQSLGAEVGTYTE